MELLARVVGREFRRMVGLPDFSKWVLTVCMIAGRLEFYTLLVVLTPGFWKK